VLLVLTALGAAEMCFQNSVPPLTEPPPPGYSTASNLTRVVLPGQWPCGGKEGKERRASVCAVHLDVRHSRASSPPIPHPTADEVPRFVMITTRLYQHGDLLTETVRAASAGDTVAEAWSGFPYSREWEMPAKAESGAGAREPAHLACFLKIWLGACAQALLGAPGAAASRRGRHPARGRLRPDEPARADSRMCWCATCGWRPVHLASPSSARIHVRRTTLGSLVGALSTCVHRGKSRAVFTAVVRGNA